MSRDLKLKEDWELVVKLLSKKFGEGEPLNLDAIIYLIGVQELGQIPKTFKKDEKVNLMHIAICRLLELLVTTNSIFLMMRDGRIIQL